VLEVKPLTVKDSFFFTKLYPDKLELYKSDIMTASDTELGKYEFINIIIL